MFFFAVFFSALAAGPLLAVSPENKNPEAVCAVYITGIGCHNCAITAPVLLSQWTSQYPDLIVFEYEIWQSKKENSSVKSTYFQNYAPGGRSGIPFLIFDEKLSYIGKYKVLAAEEDLQKMKTNAFPLPYGSSLDFSKIDLPSLEGKPVIWTKNRVLIPEKKKAVIIVS